MNVLIGLLRAVNVGGTGKLPMKDLRAMCSEIGFSDPRTYIASGNLVFGTDLDPRAAKAALEARLETDAGKPVGVLMRTPEVIEAVLNANPFPDGPKQVRHVSRRCAPVRHPGRVTHQEGCAGEARASSSNAGTIKLKISGPGRNSAQHEHHCQLVECRARRIELKAGNQHAETIRRILHRASMTSPSKRRSKRWGRTDRMGRTVLLKREDLQRFSVQAAWAYNKLATLTEAEKGARE